MFTSKFSNIAARFVPKSVHTQSYRMMSNRMLNILLIEDVERVGKAGQLVKVKPGRGRNHLIPIGSAMYDTPENRDKMKDIFGADFVIEEKEEEEEQTTVTLTPFEVQADILKRLKWSFNRRPVSPSDFTFKNVVTKEVVRGIAHDAGFHWLKASDIEFPRSHQVIKNFGEFTVGIRLETEDQTRYVQVVLKVNVADEVNSEEAQMDMEDDTAAMFA